MAQLEKYQGVLKAVLEDYLINQPAGRQSHSVEGDTETTLLTDDLHGAYAVLRHGWKGKSRVQHVVVFMRLVDGRIWIEEDWTDYDFAGRLLEAGIPPNKIELAFHHPRLRQYAGEMVL